MTRIIWITALLAACGNDGPGKDTADTDGGGKCANAILGQNPADGGTDINPRAAVDFLLAQADDSASIRVTDDAGNEVAGSSSVTGTRVLFTPTERLASNTAYDVTLEWGCDPVTASFTTNDLGDTPVDASSLIDRTWGFALTQGRVVDPPELSAVLPLMLDFDILVMVQGGDDTSLNLIGGSTADGEETQSLCAPHIDFPTPAAYSENPYMQVTADSMSLVIAGDALAVTDLLLTGTFTPDASTIEDVYLSGNVNLGSELCTLMGSSGVDCEACPTGSDATCIDLIVDSMQATERQLTVVEWGPSDYPPECDE